ncbi:MAG: MFS transporter [Actinomycetota bacterium]|nr:MFS transporter [Actinomycetota bacterium]
MTPSSEKPEPPRRAVLRSAPFRRLFAARTASRWGDTFNTIAIVILVYRISGSGVSVAATVIFEIVPVLAFGFVAGAVVDRMPRIAIMVSADLARAAIAGTLAVFGHHLGVVYAAAFAMSAFTVFFNPAATSVLPAIAGADLLDANSMIWSTAVVSQIALAPLAGVLVASAGAGPAFAINAVSFLVSAALLTRIRLPHRVPTRRRYLADIADGFAYLRTSRFLVTLAAVQGLAALSAGATSALLVVLAERNLHLGAGRFGVLLAAIGIGAGAGPLLLRRLTRKVSRPALLFGPYLLRGLVDLSLAAFDSFAGALVGLAAYGVGTSTGNVTYHTILQSVVPDERRGRVFAFYDVVWQTGRLASIGVGGVLADALGIAAVYYLGGGLLLVAGIVGFTHLRARDLGLVEL